MKKTKLIIVALAIGASTSLLIAQDDNQGPRGPQRSHQSESGRPGGFHLLPPHAEDELNLGADQKTQLAALETETKAKLEKILTAQQMKQLEEMRPPPPLQGDQGAPGQSRP